jgi:predicted metal-dependent hydrolase
VAHELAHLIEPHHNGRFWGLLERMLPGYEERKAWLAENGSRF